MPLVGFNEVVCIDLKRIEYAMEWIMHMTDGFSRFSAACIVKSKKREVIADAIFKIWIAYFGVSKKIFSDNGGVFTNELLREVGECLGIFVTISAGEAPFSNGIVERGSKVLYEAFWKTIPEVGCRKETALAWVVSANDALVLAPINWYLDKM